MKTKWVGLRAGARWMPGKDGRELRRKLNNTGRELQRVILVTSGNRTAYEAWAARQDYLRGGTLAAPCCEIGTLHTWEECGKSPRSNHCTGKAADCVVWSNKRGWINIGESKRARRAMRGHGLCLPVGQGETWHVEIGTSWLS